MSAGERLRQIGAASQKAMRQLVAGFIGAGDVADAIGYVEYAGDPTNNLAPQFIGQNCLDTSNSAWYKSHGVAAADWKKLTP